MPPYSTGSLDQDAVTLAKAIRQAESDGNPNARGKSGEYGAYQFMPSTWAAYSKEAGVNAPVEHATLEQQNQVAYHKIKEWKDKGLNPGQIAASWNAGPGEPDAYKGKFKDGRPSKGTNKMGVYYDVPGYATKVATYYHQFKGQNPLGARTAHAAETGAPQGQEQAPVKKPLSNRIAGALGFGGVVDVLGSHIARAQAETPDIKKRIEKPTTGQNVGAALQLGSLAFPYGRVAGTAAGLVGRTAAPTVARIAGGAVAGAAGGYTQDVASSLIKKDSAGETLTPGMGTALGGALGGATSILGGFKTPANKQQQAVDSVKKSVEGILNGTKSGRQWLAVQKAGGADPVDDLVKAGFIPDVQGGKVVLMDLYGRQRQDVVKRLSNLRASALDATGKDVSLESLFQSAANPQDEIIAARLRSSGNMSKIQDEVATVMKEYKKQYGDTLSMKALESIKEANASLSRRMAKTDPALSDARKQIALAAQKLIESRADESGFAGIHELNQEIKRYHVTMPELFKKLEGATVAGGRLGNILKQHTAGVVGGVAGTAVGGGIAGPVLGAITAEKIMQVLNRIMSDNTIATPVKERMIAQIAQQEPEIVQKFLQYLGQQGATIAPQLAPHAAQGAKGLVSSGARAAGGISGLITGLGSRAGAQ